MKAIKPRSFLLKSLKLPQKHPEYTFFIVAILFNVFFIFYDYFARVNTYDLMINLQSGVIEVFVLGFIVIIYNDLSAKKKTIERYKDEIAAYLPWKEPEATYRIVGLIYSLNKLNVTEIDLSGAYLPKANLRCAHLEGADLFDANLEEANLEGAHMEGIDLFDAHLEEANLEGAHMERAKLKGTHLEGAILFDAHMEGAKFRESHLEGVTLRGAYVDSPDWITMLKKWKCSGVEDIEKRYRVVSIEEGTKIVYKIEGKAPNDV